MPIRDLINRTAYNANVTAGHFAGRVAHKIGLAQALKNNAHAIIRGVNRGQQIAVSKRHFVKHSGGKKRKRKANRMMVGS